VEAKVLPPNARTTSSSTNNPQHHAGHVLVDHRQILEATTILPLILEAEALNCHYLFAKRIAATHLVSNSIQKCSHRPSEESPPKAPATWYVFEVSQRAYAFFFYIFLTIAFYHLRIVGLHPPTMCRYVSVDLLPKT
jgi:hypothetical protein